MPDVPASTISTRDMGFAGSNQDMEARYLRSDNVETLPGIVLVHDVYGVTPHIEALAQAYAGVGYAVMVPNMYSRGDGPAPGWPPRTAEIAKIGNFPDPRTIEDLKGAVSALKAREDVDANRVAIVGYSFGARYGLFATAQGAEVAALVCFYPIIIYPALHKNRPLQPLQSVNPLKTPVLVTYGERDSLVPTTHVNFFRELLRGQGKTHEFYTYPVADHGFVNTMIKTHHTEAANDAWRKTITFLDKHLRK